MVKKTRRYNKKNHKKRINKLKSSQYHKKTKKRNYYNNKLVKFGQEEDVFNIGNILNKPITMAHVKSISNSVSSLSGGGIQPIPNIMQPNLSCNSNVVPNPLVGNPYITSNPNTYSGVNGVANQGNYYPINTYKNDVPLQTKYVGGSSRNNDIKLCKCIGKCICNTVRKLTHEFIYEMTKNKKGGTLISPSIINTYNLAVGKDYIPTANPITSQLQGTYINPKPIYY